MKVVLPDKNIKTIDFTSVSIEQILLDLGINPLEVIVSRNGTLVSEDMIVGNDDEIQIIRIAHGG
ncbi:MAG: MoaD/ThiS family protein [Methanoregulaceae archaeon]|jgi:sulfur carrier protein